ncbi:MAG TPA: discoidin domain-containing protein [Streptosporangiaceae bacterium]
MAGRQRRGVRGGAGRGVAAVVSVAAVTAALLAGQPGGAQAGASRGTAAGGGYGTAALGARYRPPPVYPSVGPGTHFLNDDALLSHATLNDPGWYKSQEGWYQANIPFLQVPDSKLQQVYYYRWSVVRRNLEYTDPANGYISTEFIPPVGWGDIFNGLNDAAGHQMYEDRWLRDQQYMNDYERFWFTGAGVPYAHHFSADWIDNGVLARAEVNGDTSFATALLPELIRQYNGWNGQFDKAMGLYWSIPAYDAMEYEPATLESSNTFAGVPTFRPTLNAYQYGNARAIATIAKLGGKPQVAAEYTGKAAALQTNLQKWLWDPRRKFIYDMFDHHNPQHKLLDTREEVGFIPWYFDMPEASDASMWKQLFERQGFWAKYGPTTTERRSRWYMYQAVQPNGWDGGCCHWDGPSWPFATSQTLTGMANMLNDYPHQRYVTRAKYDRLLQVYADTQFEDGHPWVAEAANPDKPGWIYNAEDHSEHYMHSSFNDLVISGLIGIRPGLGNELTVNPQIPAGWKYFCLENVPYHGHNVTVMWDRDGTQYHAGRGLHVYVDGKLAARSATIHRLTVPIPASRVLPTDQPRNKEWVNDAANLSGTGYPKPIASYTTPQSTPWQAVDGQILYDQYEPVSRWTDYKSPNATDWLGVDFGKPTPVQDVRIYLSGAGGDYGGPASYVLQYWTGSAWADVPGQVHTPAKPVVDDLNRVTSPTVVTTKIRVLFRPKAGPYGYPAVTELESWAPPASAQLRIPPLSATAARLAAARPLPPR